MRAKPPGGLSMYCRWGVRSFKIKNLMYACLLPNSSTCLEYQDHYRLYSCWFLLLLLIFFINVKSLQIWEADLKMNGNITCTHVCKWLSCLMYIYVHSQLKIFIFLNWQEFLFFIDFNSCALFIYQHVYKENNRRDGTLEHTCDAAIRFEWH